MDDLSTSITMRLKPWELMRAFWQSRIARLQRMCGFSHVNSAYRYLQEFGDWGSGRKSDLHRLCDQVEFAVADAREEELCAVREIAELPLRVYEAAAKARRDQSAAALQCASDETLFAELTDVVRARLGQQPWHQQRREIVEAIELLKSEIAAGDEREHGDGDTAAASVSSIRRAS